MVAMCNRINGVFQVPEIEALALETGMLFTYYMGFRRIMMEGDCICTVGFLGCKEFGECRSKL